MSVELRLLPEEALEALAAGDLVSAGRAVALELPEEFLDDGPLWHLRLSDLRADPASGPWLVRAIVADGAVVGHAGFHAPPDATGTAEVGYFVVPAHRRRGHARATLDALARFAAEHGVTALRAAVGPNNDASLALIRSSGFEPAGEQWDEEDGRELVFARRL